MLPNKNHIKEKFSKHHLINNTISLIDRDSESNKFQDNIEIEEEIADIYTTNNITHDIKMLSSYEYGCLPSQSCFIENKKTYIEMNTDKYHYEPSNKLIPNNKLYNKIMIYTIDTKREIPFLLYLLRYNDINREYNFIDILIENFVSIENVLLLILKTLNLKVKYCGFIIHDNINYLFFENTNDTNDTNYTNDRNSIKQIQGYEWALISEIVNSESIFEYKISDSVKQLFLKNERLINIYNSNKTHIYEIPYSYYYIKDNTNHLFYIGDYNDVVKNIHKTKEKQDTSHIYRGVLFIGTFYQCITNKGMTNNIYKNIIYDEHIELSSINI